MPNPTKSADPLPLPLPPLGVGTWAWGDRIVWGYETDYGRADVEAAFHASLAAGLTFFDTAEVYGWGTSERILGALGRSSPAPLVLATKYAPFRPGTSAMDRALKGSLRRLAVEQIDLYQIHFPPPLVRLERLMDALAEAVHDGRLRAVGVSNFSAAQMRRAHAALARRGVPLTSNQVEYSLLHREPERDGVLRACRELGVTLMAYSPLAMGLLGGGYDPLAGRLPRRLRRYLTGARAGSIAAVLRQLKEIADTHGRTPAQVALNWLLRQPGLMAIPGAKTAHQAEENAGALGWSLSDAEAAALEQASAPAPAPSS